MKLLVDVKLEVDCPDYLDSETLQKEWLYTTQKESLLMAMKICEQQTPPANDSAMIRRRLSLLDKIAQVQRQYLQMEEARVVFGCLLNGLLELMESEYGFIGEIKTEDDGTVFLQTHAITNIAWNEETRAFYVKNSPGGLKFYNLDSLFGKVITTQLPVISNNPSADRRSCGIPKGHPPLNHFLGIPFFDHGSRHMVGMVGIANKPGGYAESDIAFLDPFVVTCSNLIQAYGVMQENKRLIDDLELKVTERTQELEQVNKDLAEANKQVVEASAAQLEHFACMSHELRTPLNGVIAVSSLLRDTDLTEMQKESLSMIIASGELLCTVVDDVLDFSKLQSGNVVVEVCETSLQKTLDAVVNAIELKASDKHVDFHNKFAARLPEFIDTDSRRLQQILYNLLGNAVKFSDDGGAVEFTVDVVDPIVDGRSEEVSIPLECPALHMGVHGHSLNDFTRIEAPSRCPFHRSSSARVIVSPPQGCPARNGILRFVVKDYGRGIDKADFGKIFEPFLQATGDTERIYGGTGLGLAITSRLVERLGGTIAVDSVLGEWSEFTVEFPCPPVTVEPMVAKLQNAHVLFVGCWQSDAIDQSAFEAFKLPVERFDTCSGLELWLKSTRALDTSSFYFCLVHEDLYDAGAYQRLAESAPSALVTFGPLHSVKESTRHFRSLCRLVPSAFMHSLIASMEDCSVPKPQVMKQHATVKELSVLIAEDNLINQKVLKQMLTRLGLKNIKVVDNGRKAVEHALASRYDVVFMDMQMPVMDGLEASRIISDHYQGDPGRPKIVFVTAHVSSSYETKAMEAGGDSFLSKPFNLPKIEKLFHSVIPYIE